MSAPIITRADIHRLLDSPGEDPVLYLNDGEVDVWVAAYVPYPTILAHRYEVVDAIGEDPDVDDVDDYLTELQQTAEELADALR